MTRKMGSESNLRCLSELASFLPYAVSNGMNESITASGSVRVGTMKAIQDVPNYRLQPTVYLASRCTAAEAEKEAGPRIGRIATLPLGPRVPGVSRARGRIMKAGQPRSPVAPLN